MEQSDESSAEQMSKLSEQLDEDITQFMEGFKQTPYKDGWAENTWKEEFDRHPFFMTKAPEPNDELSPLMEGLQQLKYDESENTPDELAATHKDDGNFNFKCKKYRDAITNYSAGIKLNCSKEMLAQLLNNRGAAHFQLKNYRSAIKDSERALQLNENYQKPRTRIAQCYYFLEKYEECIVNCDLILRENKTDSVILNLRKDAISKQRIKERDRRKLKKEDEKIEYEKGKLLEAVVQRKLKISSKKYITDLTQLEPQYANIPLKRVHLEDGKLVWPAIFLYPEYDTFDCIEHFNEDSTFQEHIDTMFSDPPEWDTCHKYLPNEINVYFRDENNEPVQLSADETLLTCMGNKRFAIKDGVLLFYLLVKNSEEERQFQQQNCIHK